MTVDRCLGDLPTDISDQDGETDIKDGAGYRCPEALVIGKVVLVIDNVPLVRKFDRLPLVYPVFFKAIAYSSFVFLFRLLEGWLSGLIDTGSVAGANHHFVDEVVWRFYIMAQVWTFVLFLVYFSFSSLVEVFRLNGRQLWLAFFHTHPALMEPGQKP